MRPNTALLAACIGMAINGQVTAGGPWEDNFDTYETGPLDGQGGWLGAGFIVDDPAFSRPNALRIALFDDAAQLFENATDGVWILAAQMYVPSKLTGSTYFILLNTYDGGNGVNWSSQVSFSETGVVQSDFDNAQLDLITDEWVQLRVIIDLARDVQTFVYGDSLLYQKSWTDGVSGNGALNIAAVDLWGNAGSAVYYDDFSLLPAPEFGACCLTDGVCLGDDVSAADCDLLGGEYQGDGSICAAAECPNIGECGIIHSLPDANGATLIVTGDTTTDDDDCDLIDGADARFEINLPFNGEWTFSLCGSSFDTVLALGATCCTDDVGFNDDSCGFQSEITANLEAGIYFVTIGGANAAASGPFTLTVSTPCLLEPPKGAIDEDEPDCGLPIDQTNSGCNDPDGDGVYQFGEIACGEIVFGSHAADGVTRDTDWYEIIVDQKTEVTMNVVAAHDINFGFIQYNEGFEGSGDCQQITGFVSPFNSAESCEQQNVAATLTPGVWWLWLGGNFDIVDCPSPYILQVTCSTNGEFGDLDGDGDVDAADLITLLGAWGPCDDCADCAADLDGDCLIGTSDLIILLGNWG